MRWPARRLPRVIVMTTALLGTWAAVPAAANAAPASPCHIAQCAGDPVSPCYGSSCVGVDPNYAGVDGSCAGHDATTLASATPPGGGPAVELRWSAWCAANWARIDGPGYEWDYWVQTRNGTAKGSIGYDGYDWTYMVDGTRQARACIESYADGGKGCTNWY